MNFIYVDASFCPKSGRAAIGIPYKQISEEINAKDSLAAELIAVIRGVCFANKFDIVCTDCLVVVNAIKTKRLIVRHEKLCAHLYVLLKKFNKVIVKWVNRKQHGIRLADRLARNALRI